MGYDDPSPQEWIETTRREAGRDDLPVTLVAMDGARHALGAVALGDADDAVTDEERAGRTPVVARDGGRTWGQRAG